MLRSVFSSSERMFVCSSGSFIRWPIPSLGFLANAVKSALAWRLKGARHHCHSKHHGGVFQPQRGGIFIGVEKQKMPNSAGAAWKTGHSAPLGLCFIFRSVTKNMPLVTELGPPR